MKKLLRIEEAAIILNCSRRTIYDLLSDGSIVAHRRDAQPGKRGIRIIASSIDIYLKRGMIPQDEWLK